MPVELPVAPIPSEDPKKKKKENGDAEGSSNAPETRKDASAEEELVSQPTNLSHTTC